MRYILSLYAQCRDIKVLWPRTVLLSFRKTIKCSCQASFDVSCDVPFDVSFNVSFHVSFHVSFNVSFNVSFDAAISRYCGPGLC
jgi:hypothetical protein